MTRCITLLLALLSAGAAQSQQVLPAGSEIDITLSSFQVTSTAGEINNPNLAFGSIQDAVGESTSTDFVIFDSLGVPVNLRLTMALESRSGSALKRCRSIRIAPPCRSRRRRSATNRPHTSTR